MLFSFKKTLLNKQLLKSKDYMKHATTPSILICFQLVFFDKGDVVCALYFIGVYVYEHT